MNEVLRTAYELGIDSCNREIRESTEKLPEIVDKDSFEWITVKERIEKAKLRKFQLVRRGEKGLLK